MATDRYVTSTGTDTYANSTNIATPMSLTTAFANAAAGDRINILAGTYTRTGTDTLTNAGTNTSPIIYRGYSASIGDGFLGRTNGSGALITTNMPTIAYNATFKFNSLAFTIVESVIFTGNITGTVAATGADSVFKSCVVTNASTNAAAVAGGAAVRGILFDCDISLIGATGGSAAIAIAVANTRVIGCRIKGGPGTGIGILVNGAIGIVIVGNVIYSTTGFGISVTNVSGVLTIINNTIVGGGSDGINVVTATTGLQCIVNNIITDNTGIGINMVSVANTGFLAYNRTRDNSGGAISSGTDWVAATTYAHVTTDTGGPETDYVASGSNDYRLLAASPATNTGWLPLSDIGGIQRGVPGASGSNTFGG